MPLLSVPCPTVLTFICILFPGKPFLAGYLEKQTTKLTRIKKKLKNVPERKGDACFTSNYSDIQGSQHDLV
jgi:hypothetical protein